MNFLWISGWAVPPEWLAEEARKAFPDAKHLAVAPSAAELAFSRKNFDVLGGYSLGALWLSKHVQDSPANIPVVLLAPIFSFPAENGEGGRIALAQLRLQRRRFRQEANTAVADFYRRSGLEGILPAMPQLTAADLVSLDMELGWLESWRAPAPPPRHWQGYVGDSDPLLDADKLNLKWRALRIVPGAGHAPGPLLRAAAAEEFQPKARR